MDLCRPDTQWKNGPLAETLYARYLRRKREPQFMVYIRVFPYRARFKIKIVKENWASAVKSFTRSLLKT